MKTRHIGARESGNAVALTLLGLAIAILAGVAVLYFIGKQAPQPIAPIINSAATSTDTTETDPRAGWKTFTDDAYHFSIQYPPGWIVATGTVLGSPVITLYDAAQELASSSATVHLADTRVSIYPIGMPTEGMRDVEYQSTVIVPVPMASAKDAQLKNGKPWATTVRFEQFPEGWTKDGFVYARLAVLEERLIYMRGETEISADEFDPFAGDRVIRDGYVDQDARTTEEEILRSLAFALPEDASDRSAGDVGDLIVVDTPAAGDAVMSPLLVKGKARGNWYFEGSFPVRLVGADGTTLAEVPATALGDWMTEEYVPFEVSLTYASTTATSGMLMLSKDNPSGLPELERSVSIPVVFSQPEP